MWTEIMSENVGVLHVNGVCCLIDVGDPSDSDVLQAKHALERRHAFEHVKQDAEELSRELEQQKCVRDRLRGTEYEGLF